MPSRLCGRYHHNMVPALTTARAVLLPLLPLLVIGSCGGQGDESQSEADPLPAQLVPSKLLQRDLLDKGRYVEGASIATVTTLEVPRGMWEVKGSNGSMEIIVRDEGGFPLGTVPIGSGVDGEGYRSIKFPLAEALLPSRLDVRVASQDGTILRLQPVMIGAEETVPGEIITLEPSKTPELISLELPAVANPGTAVLQIGGDCVRPAFLSAVFYENAPSGTTIFRARTGEGLDQRDAISIGPGGKVEAPLSVDAEGFITFSGRAENESATVRVEWLSEDGAALSEPLVMELEKGWQQGRLAIPSAAEGRLAFTSVKGDGLWIAEDRFDARSDEASPPLILLITSDTHRGDHLGVYDSEERVTTPALDELAAKSVVFRDCYAPTNVTNPSHIALMTGMPLRDTRILNNTTSLSPEANTLAESFQAAGFRTFAATSVMHLKPGLSGLHQGFDRYNAPVQGKRDGKVALEQLLEWIPDADGAPVFVWFHVYDAHAPYSPPKELVKRHYPSGQNPKSEDKSLDIPLTSLAPWIIQSKVTDRAYLDALYAGGVDYVDNLMGELLGNRRVRQGVVAFTADHGESLGEDGVWWDHTRLNHSTVHIPLILRSPGLAPARSDVAVEQIDIGKTLLSIAQIENDFPGRDLRERVGPEVPDDPRFSVSAHGWSAAVEADGWLLALQMKRYPRPFTQRTWEHGETELYYIQADPQSTNNVLEENFERAKRMRKALTRWLQDSQGGGFGKDVLLTENAQKSLEELGYAGGSTGKTTGTLWNPDPESAWNQRFAE